MLFHIVVLSAVARLLHSCAVLGIVSVCLEFLGIRLLHIRTTMRSRMFYWYYECYAYDTTYSSLCVAYSLLSF